MAPQHQALPLLLTRPEAQSDRFSADLAARFGARLRIIPSPVMRLRLLEPARPEGTFGTLILTSETGAEAAVRFRAAGWALPGRAVCVGDKTAAVARAGGIVAQSAQGDAEALIAMILSAADEGPYLHLRGREARGDIAPRLSAKGRKAEALVVYEQVAQDLKPEARSVLSDRLPVIVPVFSPRSAALLADQGPFSAPLIVVAISAAAAAAAERLSPLRIEVVSRPDAAAMMDVIAKIISEPAS